MHPEYSRPDIAADSNALTIARNQDRDQNLSSSSSFRSTESAVSITKRRAV